MKKIASEIYDRFPVITIGAIFGGALMLMGGWYVLTWIVGETVEHFTP